MMRAQALGWCVVVAALAAGTAEAVEVTFGSPAIEGRVRFLLNLPDGPIEDTDLVGLTTLSVEGFSVTDLTGLEFCVNLTSLSLGANQIADLSALANLTALETLELDGNAITDVSSLSGLSTLRNLDLSDNQIVNLTPLAGLAELRDLNLSDNAIEVIDALTTLTRLTDLNLANNFITDASPLIDNTGLGVFDSVDLTGNNLNNASLCDVIRQLEERGVDVQFDGECPGTLSGLITDATTGEPIDCAIVVATSLDPLSSDGVGPADFDGFYFVGDLSPVAFLVEAYAPGYETQTRQVTIAQFVDRTINFALQPVTRDVIPVTGNVRDMLANLPLAGVNVAAFTTQGVPIGGADSFTCADGNYELLLPTTAGTILLEFRATGYINQDAELVLANSRVRNAVLEPRNNFSATVAGVVTDRMVGGGLVGARVTIKQSGAAIARTATTNATGNYSASNLSPGAYVLQFSSALYPGEGFVETVTLVSGVNQVSVLLGPGGEEPPPPGCTVSSGTASGRTPWGDLAVFALCGAVLVAARARRSARIT